MFIEDVFDAVTKNRDAHLLLFGSGIVMHTWISSQGSHGFTWVESHVKLDCLSRDRDKPVRFVSTVIFSRGICSSDAD
ncbi:hypothetical protein DENSPDRAFT_524541 [Dentipellis sp. KUC8613]|nr:hypothetical protein DENSPDRAFT_524541 [Dentipellis sp. KUC8613]